MTFPKKKQNYTQTLKTADFVSDVYDDHVVRNFVLQYLDFLKCFVSKVSLALSKTEIS